ncbi:Hint domain-containing protein [Paracoccus onubensis]|nr:Hint domain-containing protein [Paracoccus onubensis]
MVQAVKLPVDSSVDGTTLAETIFGQGVSVISATYSGDPESKGIYTNGDATSPGVLPADSGIILSTGYVNSFTHETGSGEANRTDDYGNNMNGVDGDPRLDQIANVSEGTFDGSILQATFVPTGSTLTMQLTFSSDEYHGGYNDAVGIYVNGVRAELPIGDGDVSIQNIAPGGSNDNLYVDNAASQFNTEMDGFTVSLSVKAPVNPGVENEIWIGIADARDIGHDSNLLIAADSVQTDVIAQSDTGTMAIGGREVVDVLANDISSLTPSLTVTQINSQDVAPGDSVTLISGTVVTLNADGTLSFDASSEARQEVITYTVDDGAGTTDVGFVQVDVITCFTRGTLIETDCGLVTIEALQPGNMVFTKDDGYQSIRWIGSTKLCKRQLAFAPNLRPIRIKAGALSENIPFQDLLVSPQHRVLVRSKIAQRMFDAPEVLVAAKQLLQLDGIDVAADVETVEYFHMLFDRHEVVFSNGAETESLYTGAQALMSVGEAARDEIFSLFPELLHAGYQPIPARPIVSGQMSRKLVARHLKNNQALVRNNMIAD